MTSVSSKNPATPLATAGVGALGLPWDAWVRIGLVLAAFCWLFQDWLRAQSLHSWGMKQDWGHSFLMPVLGAYLIWQRRAEVLATPARTFWPGLLPMLLGVVCYFFFIVGVPNHMLQGYSMILTLAGAALLLTGPAMFRLLFIPIAMLVFAVMVSQQVMEKATFPLQLLASKGAWYVLKLVGMPGDWFLVEVSGNTLEVIRKGKVHPLNVAEACSGMRMVIAFLALAATVGLFSCRHWWQRIALLMLAVPVAVLMNVFRVAILGLVTLYDPTLATGDAHMMIGTILLVPSLFLFMGVVWVLNKVLREDAEPQGAAP